MLQQVHKGALMDKGQKHDDGKQAWFAMPMEVLIPLAQVYRAGEKKYSTFNCLQPFDDSSRRFYDGMMRHNAESQLDPLAKDGETGCYHLAQVAFNALMRLHHALREEKLRNARSPETDEESKEHWEK
jgi:hypothetical protein